MFMAACLIWAAMELRAFALVGARWSFRPVLSSLDMSAFRISSGGRPESSRMKTAMRPLVMRESLSA